MDCSICLETILEDKKILKCDHEFHANCIDLWFNEKKECPICRTPIEAQVNGIEQLIENEHSEVVHVQSLSIVEGLIIMGSFVSLSLSLFTRKQNELYLFFMIQSFMCLLYVCRKINTGVIKLVGLYILISFILNFSLYNLNNENYGNITLFTVFLAQYICIHIVEKNRRLENN